MRALEKKKSGTSQETIDYLAKIRTDFEPLEPPKSTKTIRFEESSEGLPTSGSWRSSLDVADMNGDGFADLVVPSQRGSESGTPSIFLGDGTGKWKRWAVRWPGRYNYGSAVAADFNKDRKTDLALGIHLSGIAILLGDGKGGFREVKRITDFPTRRIVAADVDADGWTDVVGLYEGPIVRDRKMLGKGYTFLRAWKNRKKGQEWEGVNLSGPKEGISGDWLVTANLNGDKVPDFAGSSMYYSATHTHYLSGEKGYTPFFDESALTLTTRGAYHAVAAGRFGSKKLDDTVIASTRNWPQKLDKDVLAPPPLKDVVSLDRLSFEGEKPVRTPIMRYGNDRPIYGLEAGDLDGDGHDDVIFTRHNPREAVILLGDGKGGFARAGLEGMNLPSQRNYDITLADVNGDKRPDAILMYETESATALSRRNGRIQVFLNRGAE